MEITSETHIEYQKVENTNKFSDTYRPVIVGKRNDPRLNRHQQLQIQTWRANCDIQLIIDCYACVEYLASKSEKMSSVLKNAFTAVVSKLENSQSDTVIKRLMMKSVGERDMSVQEVMHSILSLKLCSSSFQVITVSLDGSRQLEFENKEITTKKSDLDNYSKRLNYDHNLVNINLIKFYSTYELKNNCLRQRSRPVVVKTVPIISGNPKGKTYPLYCMYQLIKYKPWSENPSTLWDNLEEGNMLYVECWTEFLDSEMGKSLVPDWEKETHNLEQYVDSIDIESESEDELINSSCLKEGWMHLSELRLNNLTSNDQTESSEIDSELLNCIRQNFTFEQIMDMPFWLDRIRTDHTSEAMMTDDFDVSKLNLKQSSIYELVKNHSENSIIDPLRIIITGEGGTGKSFVIEAIKSVLLDKCVVCSYFGLAAFNVSGQTLHSFFQLPIGNRRNGDLKGIGLQRLQEKLRNVEYFILDEFSAVGVKMLGYLDRRCRQGTGKMDQFFGGLSVILLGDIAQLPPVLDKVLYHPQPRDDVSVQGFCAYNSFNIVFQLTENKRVSSPSEAAFRSILSNMRNGVNNKNDWELLSSRSVVNFSKETIENTKVRLAFSNEKVALYNHNRLKRLGYPVFCIKARHSNNKAKSISVNDFVGLQSELYLAEGAKVMLTRNLWIDEGLCNGSIGIVQHIVYKEGDLPPKLPIAVIVKFDCYNGPHFDESFSKCIPIVPCFSECHVNGEILERHQLPLRLSWAITIHC